MSVANFKPTIWLATVLRAMEKSLQYAQPAIINRDYEGEINEKGDRVKINSIGEVTIGDYTPNSDISAAEELNGAQTELVIDQAKYFNFQVDDVDKRQASGDLNGAGLKSAAYGLRDQVDQYVASLYTDIELRSGLGTEGSPLSLATATDAYENVLLPLQIALDEANTPSEGRFAIIPSWFEAKLLQDDRFVAYSGADQAAARANGAVGRAAGFTLYKSNNVPETSSHVGAKVIAGVPQAWSLAFQIPTNEVEAYRPERRFSDAVKGLTLFGAKVTHSSNLAYAICSE